MWQIMISALISNVVGLSFGFLITKLKKYRERDTVQTEALLSLLKSNLTNLYYVYKEIGKCPAYIKQTWNDMYGCYILLGGNSFVKDDIKPKWDAIESYED